jgi:hypothetical protein
LTTEFKPLPFKTEDIEEPFEPIWIHPPAFGEYVCIGVVTYSPFI